MRERERARQEKETEKRGKRQQNRRTEKGQGGGNIRAKRLNSGKHGNEEAVVGRKPPVLIRKDRTGGYFLRTPPPANKFDSESEI